MEANDILLGPDGDLLIENGDFAIGPSDEQHLSHILLSSPGHWRFHPTVGIGAHRLINSPVSLANINALKADIKKQLQQDGYKLKGDVQIVSQDTVLQPLFDYYR